MDTFDPWSVFSLLLGASTGNLSQSFINTFSVGSRPWTHPLISEASIVRTLRPENAPPDQKLAKMPEMKSLQGERSVFYACLCKKADKWPTRHQPRLFYRQLQPPPCTVSQSGVPTHLHTCLALPSTVHWESGTSHFQ